MPAVRPLHGWDVSYEEAVAIQNKLRQEVGSSPLRRAVKTVAGADVSFDKQSNKIYAAIAVLSFPSLQPVEQTIVEGKSKFPYIPAMKIREFRFTETVGEH